MPPRSIHVHRCIHRVSLQRDMACSFGVDVQIACDRTRDTVALSLPAQIDIGTYSAGYAIPNLGVFFVYSAMLLWLRIVLFPLVQGTWLLDVQERQQGGRKLLPCCSSGHLLHRGIIRPTPLRMACSHLIGAIPQLGPSRSRRRCPSDGCVGSRAAIVIAYWPVHVNKSQHY